MITASTQGNIHCNLVYLLADVMESAMMDAEQYLRRENCCIKQESRRVFNAALHNIRKMKNSVKTCSNETQRVFGNDSDYMYEIIKMVVDRVGKDDKKMYRIYNEIKSHPSNLNLTSLDDSVFDSIEYEEKLRAEKGKRIAMEVCQVDNFYAPFNKAAYWARLLAVDYMKFKGDKPKVISERLGLSTKTIKRLIDAYNREHSNETFKELAGEFYTKIMKSRNE